MLRAKKLTRTVLFVIIAFMAVSVLVSHMPSEDVLLAQEEAEPSPVVSSSIPLVTDNPYLIADIAEVASPATVFIRAEWPAPEPTTPQQRPNMRDPFSFFFDFWFSDPWYGQPQPQYQQQSAGTGFIIDESGVVITNQHVVGNRGEGQTITVVLDVPGLEREYQAQILGADATLDLAVLQILDADEESFPTVPMGDSDATRPGEWLIAIGNPYGEAFEHTVTVGVLSAKGREISVRNSDGSVQSYKNLMQTDASINPGNSGGPLLNVRGEVVGINTAVHSTGQGIGFAIPINVVKGVLNELIETGGVHHELPPKPYMGIWYTELTEDLARQLGLPDQKGVIISDVAANSPAGEAGLKPWDIIRRIGDQDITNMDDVAEVIGQHQPDDEILLTVYRDGEVHLITVKLINMPQELR